ncbi:metallophosphoesterase [Sinomicrobium sp. M5D2P9]
MKHRILLSLLVSLVVTIPGFPQPSPDNVKIAFLADVHLQDLYGTFTDTDYRGIRHPETGKYILLRTMGSQLHSTRIFNENYFAFLSALDDIAGRGIRLVALPGDYSDDGQAVHIRGLQRILKKYSDRYGIQFFITTGNHDPVGPFRQEAGKNDFLGQGGQNQVITSKKDLVKNTEEYGLPLIVSKDIAKSGYKDIMESLKDFGFSPSPEYLYWATPFSNYTPDTYSFQQAQEAALLQNRTYDVIPGFTVPDASYIVEPVPGIWLLAIDGDVHIPKDPSADPSVAENYSGAGTGYKNVLTHKKHLIRWVEKIAAQAREKNKTLIAFSHFPMIDFNDDASPLLEKLFGGKKWQLERVPPEAVAETFAKAGLRIHVGGHMHINDTGIRTYEDGNWLVNIQSPSPAAYMPGYKILTIREGQPLEAETVSLLEVPEFRTLFPLYSLEYDYLQDQQKPVWDKSILRTEQYSDFTLWHLKELVRLRFAKDWPEKLYDSIRIRKGTDFLSVLPETAAFTKKEIHLQLQNAGLTSEDFRKWDGNDLLLDFYKLRNADVLALKDIPEERIAHYNFLAGAYGKLSVDTEFLNQLKTVFECLYHFTHGAPADRFEIHLDSGKLKAIK